MIWTEIEDREPIFYATWKLSEKLVRRKKNVFDNNELAIDNFWTGSIQEWEARFLPNQNLNMMNRKFA